MVEGLSEEDRARGLAVHLVPNLRDIEGSSLPLSDDPVIGTTINNKDPYSEGPPILPSMSKFPVIFEPIRNIKFSRSVYKITSFLDFSPYVNFFAKYHKYISDFLKDMQDVDKVKMIRDPTQVFHGKREVLWRYFPTVLTNMSCKDPSVFEGNEQKFYYQWFVTTCLNRQHYEHMLEEVKYIHKVFKQVRETFFQAINHARNESQEVEESIQGTPSRSSKCIGRAETMYIKKDMLEMRGKNRTKRFLEWGAIVGLGYGVYSNAQDTKVIKKNIKVLQGENRRQDRNVNILSKYLGLTIERIRLHDVMLEQLGTRLVRLEYHLMGHLHLTSYKTFTDMLLRDATFTLSRLLTRLTDAS